MRRPCAVSASQRGFTLMEFIIVIVVLGILSVVGSSVIVDTFRTTRMVDSSQSAANQARYAMERLAREMREVKYDTATRSYNINSIASGATTASFTNMINNTARAVVVDLNSGNLRLSYGTPSILCSNVTAFNLDYRQIDNSAATSTANVRFVLISLTVRDAVSGQAVSERLRVALRNG
jgi:prepilin-type N-terminal cleavage/methylation domain-containing protein